MPTAPLSDRSIFRATNYPSAVATSNRRIVVTLASYLNRHSNPERGNCAPAGFSTTTGLNLYTGVGERNGCNNDIVVSVSDDGGASFTGATTPVWELPSLSDERRGGQLADQFWQWAPSTRRPAGSRPPPTTAGTATPSRPASSTSPCAAATATTSG